jgi:ribonuclease HII
MNKTRPSFEFENQYRGAVAGVDEAGCGPWAGPVVAAAVIIDQSLYPEIFLKRIDDSKKLNRKNREDLYKEIICHPSITYHIGISTIEEIDQFNIWGATQLAMVKAIHGLTSKPMQLLVDGKRKPNVDYPVELIVKGDQKSFSIATASILAKVKRDEIMGELHREYPDFGWDKNAGYGTAEHQRALKHVGITPYHRKSFAPIRSIISQPR